MEKKKVLIITQEMDPYLAITGAAKIANGVPKQMFESGMEIRVLMPKFGTINERRHRLHEVVRLSGMNIIIHDEDYPLVIKVASLPGARLQVYFLDNEDFFKRKMVFHDENNNFFEDNSDRMIFFCKGALETVRKFGWPPDIIHCFGWMTSLIPLYLKTTYKDDPVFANAKVVFNVFENEFKEKLKSDFTTKLAISDDIQKKHIEFFKNADNTSLLIGGAEFADALVVGDKLDTKVKSYVKKFKNKAVLKLSSDEEDPVMRVSEFYRNIWAN
ncbi:MAG: glycogen/starch synthase [Chitinophagales bacterium]|nr:glycogen/starch synthase [Chitinophagales bacterium]MDW8418557.1 glycogen/starch synthase [Chitinophagales bacterium]